MPVTKVSKEEILHRCWQEIHQHGYYNTSISQLAKAVGLGKAGLLHHFGSKEALMHAVLDYAFDQFRAYVLAVAKEDLPWEQRLEKMLRRHKNLVTIERRGCFFANTILETGRDDIFNQAILGILQEWQSVLAHLLTERFSPEEAKSLAYQLQLSFEGAVVFYKLSNDKSHLESFIHWALAQTNPQ